MDFDDRKQIKKNANISRSLARIIEDDKVMLTVKGKHITSMFRDSPWHFGTYHAGTESEFLPTDTKEHFEKLCETEEYREYFKAQGWLEPGAITYKINSHGFRCDELTANTDCIVALGCSFTLGIGLPIEATWPALVSKELGIKVYNLGIVTKIRIH